MNKRNDTLFVLLKRTNMLLDESDSVGYLFKKPMQKHFDSEKSVWWIAAWSIDMIRTCGKEAIRLLELKWKPQLIHQADYANLKKRLSSVTITNR